MGLDVHIDTWNGSAYNSVERYSSVYSYDLVKNLRTGATFTWKDDTGTPIWSRSDVYGYDTIDQLTSANYGAGATTWDYDAAGNRISDSSNPGTWTNDNLNRMSASPGFSHTNDILGNRLTRGSTTYGWDILNRMTSFTSGSTSTYEYRADGLRTKKTRLSETTTYFYDGQMAIEEQVTGDKPNVTSYGIGARGIDIIAKDGAISFPIYDGHGNMISTLARNGLSYTTSNLRYYDAWGQIRQGATSGDPSQRHCANLGHKQDDESGLVYMRARYYEASTGKFISEDPARDGANWFAYCKNDPVNNIDTDGRLTTAEAYGLIANLLMSLGRNFMGLASVSSVQGAFERVMETITKEAVKTFLSGAAKETVEALLKLKEWVDRVKGMFESIHTMNANKGISGVAGYTILLYGMLYMIDAEGMGYSGSWWGMGGDD